MLAVRCDPMLLASQEERGLRIADEFLDGGALRGQKSRAVLRVIANIHQSQKQDAAARLEWLEDA